MLHFLSWERSEVATLLLLLSLEDLYMRNKAQKFDCRHTSFEILRFTLGEWSDMNLKVCISFAHSI